MKKFLVFTFVACLGGLSLTIGPAQSQQRPPAPDFRAMAAELGVPEAALMGCMGERPEPGMRPGRPDPAKIAACLTDAGNSVSSSAVDAALRASAPPPRRQ